jgi:glycine betaine/choline ABC-type transport system substrate-binding protein
MVCFEALRAGAIDLYPEYTGTGLMAILGLPVETDPELVFQLVSERFAVQYDMLWLPPLGTFNNTYALAMTEARAVELGIERISDLFAHRELTCGFTNEFMVRDDGYPGLREAYGLDFERPPKSMEAGLMYGAVAAGAVDVICSYATDGRVESLGLRTLVDDRDFFPPYQAAPLLRRPLLAGNPELGLALGRLDRHISDADMRRLNGAVDSGAVTPAAAARDYLSRSGLLGS